MEIEFLKRIITNQKDEFNKLFKNYIIIKRDYMSYIKKFLEHPNILTILGVRRSGKSTYSILLAEEIMKKNSFGYINFDDERLLGLKTEDLEKIMQAFNELYGDIELVIIDEPQNIMGWELFANRLRRTKKVIITGSNSQLLSGELSIHLTGRHIDFNLYPMSFKEILDFNPNFYLIEDIAKIQTQLEAYLNGSGFPEFKNFGSKIIEGIYQDIINKDCLNRYKIRNKKTFKELANYLISNFSNEFTYSKLSAVFNIKDIHTIKNYIDYLKESFLIIVLDRYSPRLKQQVIAPKKVYSIDHGICNFLSFKQSQNLGRLMENVICIELFRRKSIKNKLEYYYWKDYQQAEVDFVIKEGHKVIELIQACYDLSDIETKQREINSLIKGSKDLRCKKLLIITRDQEHEEKLYGLKIKYIPLWKWLLVEK